MSVLRKVLSVASAVVAMSVPGRAESPVAVTFWYDDAKAASVGVAGDFSKGTVLPMMRDAKGTWSKTLFLKPGNYGYRFRVNDNRWALDPNNSANQVVNGVQTSVLSVGGATAPAAATAPAPVAPAGPAKLGDVQLNAGEVAHLDVPLSAAAWDEAGRLPAPGGDSPISHNTKPKSVKMAIAVPVGFDPSRSWPLLIVNSTADAPSIEHLNLYHKPATEIGWVVLAADGPDKPKNDGNAWRWALAASALESLRSQWPASKDWPVACGGFSGGAKRSGFFGALMTKKGYNVIGIWMGGCNEDMASWGLSLYQPNYGSFTKIPIFLSSGTRDDIAKPDSVKGVMENMKRKMFRKVRLESYDGAHDPSPEQIKLGLNWFLEEAKK